MIYNVAKYRELLIWKNRLSRNTEIYFVPADVWRTHMLVWIKLTTILSKAMKRASLDLRVFCKRQKTWCEIKVPMKVTVRMETAAVKWQRLHFSLTLQLPHNLDTSTPMEESQVVLLIWVVIFHIDYCKYIFFSYCNFRKFTTTRSQIYKN